MVGETFCGGARTATPRSSDIRFGYVRPQCQDIKRQQKAAVLGLPSRTPTRWNRGKMERIMRGSRAVRMPVGRIIPRHRAGNSIQSIRGVYSHGPAKGDPTSPRVFSSPWPAAAIGAGVTGLGFTLWQFTQPRSSQTRQQQTEYADKETMLKVRGIEDLIG